MNQSTLPAQRRFAAECTVIGGAALVWLASLVSARRGSPEHRRMWRLLGVSALSWGSGQAAWAWYETVLGREVQAGADNGLSQAISLAYPIGDVVVLTIVLFMLARARRNQGVTEIPLHLIGAGLVARPWSRAACPPPRWSWR